MSCKQGEWRLIICIRMLLSQCSLVLKNVCKTKKKYFPDVSSSQFSFSLQMWLALNPYKFCDTSHPSSFRIASVLPHFGVGDQWQLFQHVSDSMGQRISCLYWDYFYITDVFLFEEEYYSCKAAAAPKLNFITAFDILYVNKPITSHWSVTCCLCFRGRWRSSWQRCRTVRGDTLKPCSSCRDSSQRPRYCNSSPFKISALIKSWTTAVITSSKAAAKGRCHYLYSWENGL